MTYVPFLGNSNKPVNFSWIGPCKIHHITWQTAVFMFSGQRNMRLANGVVLLLIHLFVHQFINFACCSCSHDNCTFVVVTFSMLASAQLLVVVLLPKILFSHNGRTGIQQLLSAPLFRMTMFTSISKGHQFHWKGTKANFTRETKIAKNLTTAPFVFFWRFCRYVSLFMNGAARHFSYEGLFMSNGGYQRKFPLHNTEKGTSSNTSFSWQVEFELRFEACMNIRFTLQVVAGMEPRWRGGLETCPVKLLWTVHSQIVISHDNDCCLSTWTQLNRHKSTVMPFGSLFNSNKTMPILGPLYMKTAAQHCFLTRKFQDKKEKQTEAHFQEILRQNEVPVAAAPLCCAPLTTGDSHGTNHQPELCNADHEELWGIIPHWNQRFCRWRFFFMFYCESQKLRKKQMAVPGIIFYIFQGVFFIFISGYAVPNMAPAKRRMRPFLKQCKRKRSPELK